MLTVFEVPGVSLAAPRKVWVQRALAPSAANCLVFLDAEFYLDKVRAPTILLDLQRAGSLPGATAVYVSHVDLMARARDLVCDDRFASFVADDLLGWIERSLGRFERFFLCGLSLSALEATFVALRHPATFHGVLAQSPSAWWQDERLVKVIAPGLASGSRFWISVGEQETQENVLHSPAGLSQKASQRDSVRRLAQALQGRCRELHYNEFPGAHEMTCWAQELPRALPWLLHDAAD
ncbi:MAG TPA: alpha/beta hydrolase-fold protein [Croceibacterium sp.]|jgi:enterochelin esterase family protein